MVPFEFPEFEPARYARGANAQTILGAYLPGQRYRYRAHRRHVNLPDGDRVVLHDDCPPSWRPGGRTALLVHGLEGCHRSGYMVRVAAKLNGAGVRTFRMDLRNCGAGLDLARTPYHAGCSSDALAAAEAISALCPDSPVTLVGFSLGGNIVLKSLGECPYAVPAAVDSAMAVNPAIDLGACNLWLNRYGSSFYDRHFAKLLYQKARRLRGILPSAEAFLRAPRPRSLREFDKLFTAPVCGFASVEDYYARASSAPLIPQIRIPTWVLTSRDDPMIPSESFERLPLNPSVRVHIACGGGHLGYIGRAGVDRDRRWMDWRVVDWLRAVERYRGFEAPPSHAERPAPAPLLA